MKYTVVTTTFADHQLATMWLRAVDRQYVTDAFDRIDSLLKNDPDRLVNCAPTAFVRSSSIHLS